LCAAKLPEKALEGAGAHIAAERTAEGAAERTAEVERRAAAGTAAPNTAEAALVEREGAAAGLRTAAAAVVEREEAAELARQARAAAAGRRNPAGVVAMAPPAIRDRPASVEARRPHKPPPPSPVRRRKGSLFSRGERRVRIADISS